MDKQQLSPTEPQQQLLPKQKQELNKQLLTAARGNYELEVEALLKNGAEINAVDINGNTALMLACMKNGNVKIVELLLNNNANINIQSQYGDTAFSWACYNGNLDIAELLLKNDASVNAKGKSGNTPLMLACLNNNNVKIVEWLLKNRADMKVANEDGETPLIFACYNGNLDIVKFLIENGADVNAKTKSGNTPLISICMDDKVEMAKILIANKADVNSKNKNGNTALMLACWGRKLEMTKFLIENGADVNIQELDPVRYFKIPQLKELAKSLLESQYLNNKTDKTNNLSEERKNKLLEQKCQTKEDSVKFITELCKRIKASRLLIMQIKAMQSPASKISSEIYRTEIPLHIANEILYDCNTQEDNSQKNNSL